MAPKKSSTKQQSITPEQVTPAPEPKPEPKPAPFVSLAVDTSESPSIFAPKPEPKPEPLTPEQVEALPRIVTFADVLRALPAGANSGTGDGFAVARCKDSTKARVTLDDYVQPAFPALRADSEALRALHAMHDRAVNFPADAFADAFCAVLRTLTPDQLRGVCASMLHPAEVTVQVVTDTEKQAKQSRDKLAATQCAEGFVQVEALGAFLAKNAAEVEAAEVAQQVAFFTQQGYSEKVARQMVKAARAAAAAEANIEAAKKEAATK